MIKLGEEFVQQERSVWQKDKYVTESVTPPAFTYCFGVSALRDVAEPNLRSKLAGAVRQTSFRRENIVFARIAAAW